MTQPEDKYDPFFDPDIIYPDQGENAIIVQPNGNIPEYVHTENFCVGPTVDSETIWIPQTTESEEMDTTEFKQLDADKFCGIPAFFKIVKLDLMICYYYSYIQIGCHFI